MFPHCSISHDDEVRGVSVLIGNGFQGATIDLLRKGSQLLRVIDDYEVDLCR